MDTWTYDDCKDWIFKNLPDAPKSKVGDFSKFVMPIIKRAMPQMLVDQLVAVQPMQVPAANVFHFLP